MNRIGGRWDGLVVRRCAQLRGRWDGLVVRRCAQLRTVAKTSGRYETEESGYRGRLRGRTHTELIMAAGRPDSALAAKSVTTSIPIVFTNADSWIWWYYGSPEGLSVPHRTLHRLVEEEQQQGGGVFGPDDIAIMTKAFDLLLAECKLTDRTDPVVTMVAKLVIELVRNGERDPEKIRQKIIGGVKFL